MSIVDDFPTLAVSAFEWLTNRFAFRVVNQRAITRNRRPILSTVTFRNDRMFVELILECPRPFLDVQFGPVVAGQVPDNNDLGNRFHLDQLRALAAMNKEGELPAHVDLSGLGRREVVRVAESASRELEVLGDPMFAGDDKTFELLRADSGQRIDHYQRKYLRR